MSFADPLPWLDVSVSTNLTEAISNASRRVLNCDLPLPVFVQREPVTNITITTRGVVCLNRAGYNHPNTSHSPTDLQMESVDSNAFVVVAYGNYLDLYDADQPSAVMMGAAEHAGRGYLVIEYDNMYRGRPSQTTNAISFQIAIPTGRVDRIGLRYADVLGASMDGGDAIIGCQSFGAEDRVSYCREEHGKIRDGMGLSFMVGYGTDPLSADTDGDGIPDGTEVNTHRSNPKSVDTDADGLPDAQEAMLGTSLGNPDSDGDGLLDSWEVVNNFNPLSSVGNDGADGDIDNDTLSNLQEQAAGSNPWNADTDNDGLSDSAEVQEKTKPTLPDTDYDGLPDGQEVAIGTNPLQPDSDSDGMNDAWEYQYDFDPTVNNATDDNPNNDIDADPDHDGLTNGEECNFGTNPFDSDSDGDGVDDGTEVGQNSDPADASDGGQPNSRVAVPFTFGDPSGSHSEKYFLEVVPVPVEGLASPPSFSWLNEQYGQCETKIAMLKPGWAYEVRLYHAGTISSRDGDPDYDYELDFAGNDTTEGVIKDDPEGLFGIDYTSDSFAGEGKVAYLYALAPPKLVPDYDRDGEITDGDAHKAAQKKKFRFWINDDEDKYSAYGRYADSPTVDIPGAKTGWFGFGWRDPDWKDNKVNGYRDLVDFTPVFMDVSTIQFLPERIRNNLSFKISHAAEAVNVVWTDLPKSSVGLFQKETVNGCGPGLDQASCNSAVAKVKATGTAVPSALAAQMKTANSNIGVAFIEGREASSDPLELDIYYNDTKVVSGKLPLELSPVEEMYWFYSIRGAENNPEASIPNGNSPDNLMDGPTDIDVFFTHGFNVDADAACGWGAEIFKRLWQSGANTSFHMVTWAGDYRVGEDMNPLEIMNGFFYHRDVQYALNSADVYKRLVESVQPDKSNRVLMAQSLGNMVTCEAIRLGLGAEKYYMFNAAVASETIMSTLQNLDGTIKQKFVPPDWRNYNPLSWAANWHRLFPHDDRSYIGWPGYFSSGLSGIPEVCNYYSSGDPVLVSTTDVPSALTKTLHVQWPISFSWNWPIIRFQSFEFQATFERFAWQKQEVLKGVNPYLATLEGGWGFHSWPVHMLNGETQWRTFTAQEAHEMVANSSILSNAVFERSVTAMFSPIIPLADRNRILAYNIPAVSESIGSTPTFERQSKFVDLNSSAYKNGWGRSGNPYNDQWLHSDMKDMAYYYVFRLYDELVQNIQGNAQ